MNSNEFVALIEELIKKNVTFPYTLGKIDPLYAGVGNPRVVFDGSEEASLKEYSRLSSYTPTANDRVLLVNIAGTHVIIGAVI